MRPTRCVALHPGRSPWPRGTRRDTRAYCSSGDPTSRTAKSPSPTHRPRQQTAHRQSDQAGRAAASKRRRPGARSRPRTVLDAVAAPRRGSKATPIARSRRKLFPVAEAEPRRGSVELRPQGEVVVVALVRSPHEMSHTPWRDQQRRRRGTLLSRRFEAVLAPIQVKVAQRTDRHGLILPQPTNDTQRLGLFPAGVVRSAASSEGIVNSAEIALQIATGVGGEAHGI